jgi:hypothetical protein
MFVSLFQIRRQQTFDPFHECADSARQIAPMCYDEGHGERPATAHALPEPDGVPWRTSRTRPKPDFASTAARRKRPLDNEPSHIIGFPEALN